MPSAVWNGDKLLTRHIRLSFSLDRLADWKGDPVPSGFGGRPLVVRSRLSCRSMLGVTSVASRVCTDFWKRLNRCVTFRQETNRATIDQAKRGLIRRPASLAWRRSPLLRPQCALRTFFLELYSLVSPRHVQSNLSNNSFYSNQIKCITSLWSACLWRGNRPLWQEHRPSIYPFCPTPSSHPNYDVDAIQQYVPQTWAICAYHKIFPLMTDHTISSTYYPQGLGTCISLASTHNTSRRRHFIPPRLANPKRVPHVRTTA